MKFWRGGPRSALLCIVIAAAALPVSPDTSFATHEVRTHNWSGAGRMMVPRYNHTSTVLPQGGNDPVLVVGGTSTSTEIFPPGNLSVGPVQLPLSVGSISKVTAASAELFDPATRTWVTTAPPSIPRAGGHTATWVGGWQVLVVGGMDLDPNATLDHHGNAASPASSGAAALPELYSTFSPQQPGTWAPAGALNDPRAWHTATMLGTETPGIFSDDKVLVLGGASPVPSANTGRRSARTVVPTGSAETFATLTGLGWEGGTWAKLNRSLATPRFNHVTTPLKTGDKAGQLLVTGGKTVDSGGNIRWLRSWELFEPRLDRPQPPPPPPEDDPDAQILEFGRAGHTSTPLPDGRVLVVGGEQAPTTVGNETGIILSSAEIYDPVQNTWCRGMRTNYYHRDSSASLLGTDAEGNYMVLVAGESGAEIFTSSATGCGTWRKTQSPLLPRSGHTADVLSSGKVLVSGGGNSSSSNISTSSSEIFSSEPVPELSINDVSVKEGNPGASPKVTFTVSLARPPNWPSSKPVTVGLFTRDREASSVATGPPVNTTATPSAPDYVPVPASAAPQPSLASIGVPLEYRTEALSFAAGETSKRVSVNLVSDAVPEGDEDFEVVLANPFNATFAACHRPACRDGVGRGTILNDDDPAAIYATVEDASPVTETNVAPGPNARFRVVLSSTPARTVTLAYSTMDGTARTMDGDYQGHPRTVLTFPAGGSTSQEITVPVNSDHSFESEEIFFLNLSSPTGGVVIADHQAVAVVRDDDSPPIADISDAQVREGTLPGSQSVARFSISLSKPSPTDVVVGYQTEEGTANDGSPVSDAAGPDYGPVAGTVTIPAGSTDPVEVAVQIAGDFTWEPPEIFFVRLTEVSEGATLGKAVGSGLIGNDDCVQVGSTCVFVNQPPF